jgi:hypothetical protein
MSKTEEEARFVSEASRLKHQSGSEPARLVADWVADLSGLDQSCYLGACLCGEGMG